LPLAVVTEASRLQYAWQPQTRDSGAQVFERIDGVERRRRNAQLPEQLFLQQPILRYAQCLDRRQAGARTRNLLQGGDRNVLEFVCHQVDIRRQSFETHGIVECDSMWNTLNNSYEYWLDPNPRQPMQKRLRSRASPKRSVATAM